MLPKRFSLPERDPISYLILTEGNFKRTTGHFIKSHLGFKRERIESIYWCQHDRRGGIKYAIEKKNIQWSDVKYAAVEQFRSVAVNQVIL
jgi:hypothetical protein